MKSMTGFGKGSAETPDVQIEIEIKSVNQRFLDLQLRMPKQLNPLEGALRQSIKQTLQRGRIELYVTLKEKTQIRNRSRSNGTCWNVSCRRSIPKSKTVLT